MSRFEGQWWADRVKSFSFGDFDSQTVDVAYDVFRLLFTKASKNGTKKEPKYSDLLDVVDIVLPRYGLDDDGPIASRLNRAFFKWFREEYGAITSSAVGAEENGGRQKRGVDDKKYSEKKSDMSIRSGPSRSTTSREGSKDSTTEKDGKKISIVEYPSPEFGGRGASGVQASTVRNSHENTSKPSSTTPHSSPGTAKKAARPKNVERPRTPGVRKTRQSLPFDGNTMGADRIGVDRVAPGRTGEDEKPALPTRPMVGKNRGSYSSNAYGAKLFSKPFPEMVTDAQKRAAKYDNVFDPKPRAPNREARGAPDRIDEFNASNKSFGQDSGHLLHLSERDSYGEDVVRESDITFHMPNITFQMPNSSNQRDSQTSQRDSAKDDRRDVSMERVSLSPAIHYNDDYSFKQYAEERPRTRSPAPATIERSDSAARERTANVGGTNSLFAGGNSASSTQNLRPTLPGDVMGSEIISANSYAKIHQEATASAAAKDRTQVEEKAAAKPYEYRSIFENLNEDVQNLSNDIDMKILSLAQENSSSDKKKITKADVNLNILKDLGLDNSGVLESARQGETEEDRKYRTHMDDLVRDVLETTPDFGSMLIERPKKAVESDASSIDVFASPNSVTQIPGPESDDARVIANNRLERDLERRFYQGKDHFTNRHIMEYANMVSGKRLLSSYQQGENSDDGSVFSNERLRTNVVSGHGNFNNMRRQFNRINPGSGAGLATNQIIPTSQRYQYGSEAEYSISSSVENFDSHRIIAQAFRFRHLQKLHFVMWRQQLELTLAKLSLADDFYVGKHGLPRSRQKLRQLFHTFVEGIRVSQAQSNRISKLQGRSVARINRNLKLLCFREWQGFYRLQNQVREFQLKRMDRYREDVMRGWLAKMQKLRMKHSYWVLALFTEWRNLVLEKKIVQFQREIDNYEKSYTDALPREFLIRNYPGDFQRQDWNVFRRPTLESLSPRRSGLGKRSQSARGSQRNSLATSPQRGVSLMYLGVSPHRQCSPIGHSSRIPRLGDPSAMDQRRMSITAPMSKASRSVSALSFARGSSLRIAPCESLSRGPSATSYSRVSSPGKSTASPSKNAGSRRMSPASRRSRSSSPSKASPKKQGVSPKKRKSSAEGKPKRATSPKKSAKAKATVATSSRGGAVTYPSSSMRLGPSLRPHLLEAPARSRSSMKKPSFRPVPGVKTSLSCMIGGTKRNSKSKKRGTSSAGGVENTTSVRNLSPAKLDESVMYPNDSEQRGSQVRYSQDETFPEDSYLYGMNLVTDASVSMHHQPDLDNSYEILLSPRKPGRGSRSPSRRIGLGSQSPSRYLTAHYQDTLLASLPDLQENHNAYLQALKKKEKFHREVHTHFIGGKKMLIPPPVIEHPPHFNAHISREKVSVLENLYSRRQERKQWQYLRLRRRQSCQQRCLLRSDDPNALLRSVMTEWKMIGDKVRVIRKNADEVQKMKKRLQLRNFALQIFAIREKKAKRLEQDAKIRELQMKRVFRNMGWFVDVKWKQQKEAETAKWTNHCRKLFLTRWFAFSCEKRRQQTLLTTCLTCVRKKHLINRMLSAWHLLILMRRNRVGVMIGRRGKLRLQKAFNDWFDNMTFRNSIEKSCQEVDRVVYKRRLMQKGLKSFHEATFGKSAIPMIKYEQQMWALQVWIKRYTNENPHQSVPNQIQFKNTFCDFRIQDYIRQYGSRYPQQNFDMSRGGGNHDESSIFITEDRETVCGPHVPSSTAVANFSNDVVQCQAIQPHQFPTKVLVSLFQAPFDIHPHRFRKNFVRNLLLFKHTVMRKMFLTWRKIIVREKFFSLKMRFNVIYDNFIEYAQIVKKLRKNRHKGELIMWTRHQREMRNYFGRWESKFHQYRTFRQDFVAFRGKKMHNYFEKAFHWWSYQTEKGKNLREKGRFVYEKHNQIIAGTILDTMWRQVMVSQRWNTMCDIATLHYYKRTGTKVFAIWKQELIHGKMLAYCRLIKVKKLLVKFFHGWAQYRGECLQERRNWEMAENYYVKRLLRTNYKAFKNTLQHALYANKKVSHDLRGRERKLLMIILTNWQGFTERKKDLKQKTVSFNRYIRHKNLRLAYKRLGAAVGVGRSLRFFTHVVEKVALKYAVSRWLFFSKCQLMHDVDVFSHMLAFKMKSLLAGWRKAAVLTKKIKDSAGILFELRLKSFFNHFAHNSQKRIAIRTKIADTERKCLSEGFFSWRWQAQRLLFFSRATNVMMNVIARRMAKNAMKEWRTQTKINLRLNRTANKLSMTSNLRMLIEHFDMWASNASQATRLKRLELGCETQLLSKVLHNWYKFAMVEKCVKAGYCIVRSTRLFRERQVLFETWYGKYMSRRQFREKLADFNQNKVSRLRWTAFDSWRMGVEWKIHQKNKLTEIQTATLRECTSNAFSNWVTAVDFAMQRRAGATKLMNALNHAMLRYNFHRLDSVVTRVVRAEERQMATVNFVRRRYLRPVMKAWTHFLLECKRERVQLEVAAKHQKLSAYTSHFSLWCCYVVYRRTKRFQFRQNEIQLQLLKQEHAIQNWRDIAKRRKQTKKLCLVSKLFNEARLKRNTLARWRYYRNSVVFKARKYEAIVLEKWNIGVVIELSSYLQFLNHLYKTDARTTLVSASTVAGGYGLYMEPRSVPSRAKVQETLELFSSPEILMQEQIESVDSSSPRSPRRKMESSVIAIGFTSQQQVVSPFKTADSLALNDYARASSYEAVVNSRDRLFKPAPKSERVVVLFQVHKCLQRVEKFFEAWQSRVGHVHQIRDRLARQRGKQMAFRAFQSLQFNVHEEQERRRNLEELHRRAVLNKRMNVWKKYFVYIENQRCQQKEYEVHHRLKRSFGSWKQYYFRRKALQEKYTLFRTEERQLEKTTREKEYVFDVWLQAWRRKTAIRTIIVGQRRSVLSLYFRKWAYISNDAMLKQELSLEVTKMRTKIQLSRWFAQFKLSIVCYQRRPLIYYMAFPCTMQNQTSNVQSSMTPTIDNYGFRFQHVSGIGKCQKVFASWAKYTRFRVVERQLVENYRQSVYKRRLKALYDRWYSEYERSIDTLAKFQGYYPKNVYAKFFRQWSILLEFRHHCILATQILERLKLQSMLKSRWRKHALECKQRKAIYEKLKLRHVARVQQSYFGIMRKLYQAKVMHKKILVGKLITEWRSLVLENMASKQFLRTMLIKRWWTTSTENRRLRQQEAYLCARRASIQKNMAFRLLRSTAHTQKRLRDVQFDLQRRKFKATFCAWSRLVLVREFTENLVKILQKRISRMKSDAISSYFDSKESIDRKRRRDSTDSKDTESTGKGLIKEALDTSKDSTAVIDEGSKQSLASYESAPLVENPAHGTDVSITHLHRNLLSVDGKGSRSGNVLSADILNQQKSKSSVEDELLHTVPEERSDDLNNSKRPSLAMPLVSIMSGQDRSDAKSLDLKAGIQIPLHRNTATNGPTSTTNGPLSLQESFAMWRDTSEEASSNAAKCALFLKRSALRCWLSLTKTHTRKRAFEYRAKQFYNRTVLCQKYFGYWRERYHIPRMDLMDYRIPTLARKADLKTVRKNFREWQATTKQEMAVRYFILHRSFHFWSEHVSARADERVAYAKRWDKVQKKNVFSAWNTQGNAIVRKVFSEWLGWTHEQKIVGKVTAMKATSGSIERLLRDMQSNVASSPGESDLSYVHSKAPMDGNTYNVNDDLPHYSRPDVDVSALQDWDPSPRLRPPIAMKDSLSNSVISSHDSGHSFASLFSPIRKPGLNFRGNPASARDNLRKINNSTDSSFHISPKRSHVNYSVDSLLSPNFGAESSSRKK